jgi:hypothetical protein
MGDEQQQKMYCSRQWNTVILTIDSPRLDARPATASGLTRRRETRMPTPINDHAFEFLLARAGLTLTDAEKADLRTVVENIAAMAERVRKPRGIMAEPVLTYGFAEEDL